MSTEYEKRGYNNALSKFNDMHKHDVLNTRQLSDERYNIMNDLMDSMNPQKQQISTDDLNSKIDSYLNKHETNTANNSDKDMYKNMAKYLNDQIDKLTLSPNFDIAKDSSELNVLLNDLKKVNMKLN